jgi:hypothetical protein
MCLLHPENKSLHQLASIATNKLCEFIRLFLVALKEKLMMQLSPPAHLRINIKTQPTERKKPPHRVMSLLIFFESLCMVIHGLPEA